MPERDHYAPGTPSWVDLGSPDLAASVRFYGQLFGWQATTSDDPDAGGYTMFNLRGLPVAGGGPNFADQPAAWTTYVTVQDADATVATAKAAGGSVFLEPMDVLEVGRMAILGDPTGGAIALWQPRAHKGAALVNEPGTLCWNELMTRDPERARAFYKRVFGWDAVRAQGPVPYTEWHLGGSAIGGMLVLGDEFPPDVPTHWSVYFAVADCQDTVRRAKDLGGTVHVPPTQIPPGQFSLLADPHGATFNVLQLAE